MVCKKMNGILGLIPLLIVRMLMLKLLGQSASQRAGFFAPMPKERKVFYYLYQLSQLTLILLTFYYSITWSTWRNYVGGILWLIGLVISFFSVYYFAKPDAGGLNQRGIYRLSRHPMYVGYYFYYAGLTLLMNAMLYVPVLILFILSSHFIILAEEEWCRQKFGENYQQYQLKVRRYL